MEEFGAFFKKQQDKLLSYLMRITGDYYLSMDLMQESFTRYFEKYANNTRNVSLLYTIARNSFLDFKRRSGRFVSLEQEYEDLSANQADSFQIKQEYMQVLSAMKELEYDEREILALVLSGELNYKEIASITKTSEANIKVKVHRARIKIKKKLHAGE
jgi:RNA polymerase sigma-70 factor (ECF subfamily)